MVKKRFAAGFDVGGTKCAVILGELTGEGGIEILAKKRFATADFRAPEACLADALVGGDGLGIFSTCPESQKTS